MTLKDDLNVKVNGTERWPSLSWTTFVWTPILLTSFFLKYLAEEMIKMAYRVYSNLIILIKKINKYKKLIFMNPLSICIWQHNITLSILLKNHLICNDIFHSLFDMYNSFIPIYYLLSSLTLIKYHYFPISIHLVSNSFCYLNHLLF